MSKEDAKALLKKYLRGECNDEERKLLESWYNRQVQKESLSGDIDYEFLEKHIWAKTDRYDNKRGKTLYVKLVAAALVLIVSAVSMYFFIGKADVGQSGIAILPGGNTAVLSFSDGKEIDLDNVAEGEDIILGPRS